MKIEIDTSRDSHTEIKKVIAMLSNLVGDHAVFDAAIHVAHEKTHQENKTETEKVSAGMSMFDFSDDGDDAPSGSSTSSSDGMYASETNTKKSTDFNFFSISSDDDVSSGSSQRSNDSLGRSMESSMNRSSESSLHSSASSFFNDIPSSSLNSSSSNSSNSSYDRTYGSEPAKKKKLDFDFKDLVSY